MTMSRTTKHIILPLILPIAFFIVAALPEDLLGCALQGFVAYLIALAGGILAISAAVRAIITRVRKDPTTNLWMLTTLILAIPAIYIVIFET